jgi:hypothetical protein
MTTEAFSHAAHGQLRTACHAESSHLRVARREVACAAPPDPESLYVVDSSRCPHVNRIQAAALDVDRATHRAALSTFTVTHSAAALGVHGAHLAAPGASTARLAGSPRPTARESRSNTRHVVRREAPTARQLESRSGPRVARRGFVAAGAALVPGLTEFATHAAHEPPTAALTSRKGCFARRPNTLHATSRLRSRGDRTRLPRCTRVTDRSPHVASRLLPPFDRTRST